MSMFDRLDKTLKGDRERQAKSGTNFFRFKKGKTRFRVVPAAPKDDEGNWFIPVGYHYNIPGQNGPVVCRSETQYANEKCPVCDLVAEMRQTDRNDEAQKLNVRRRRLIRAVVRGEEEKGAQLLDLPVTVFMTMGETIRDTENFGNVLHVQKGRDFILHKEGEGINTKYQIQAHPKVCSLLPTKDETLGLLKKLKPIDGMISLPDEEDVEKILYAQADDDADDASFGDSAKGSDSDWDGDDDDGVGDDVPSDDDSSDEKNSDDLIDDSDDDGDDEEWLGDEGKDKDDDDFEDDDPKETVAQVRKSMQEKAAKAGAAKRTSTSTSTSKKRASSRKKKE